MIALIQQEFRKYVVAQTDPSLEYFSRLAPS